MVWLSGDRSASRYFPPDRPELPELPDRPDEPDDPPELSEVFELPDELSEVFELPDELSELSEVFELPDELSELSDVLELPELSIDSVFSPESFPLDEPRSSDISESFDVERLPLFSLRRSSMRSTRMLRSAPTRPLILIRWLIESCFAVPPMIRTSGFIVIVLWPR